jgi:murein DD-endopeptidase MepM/ murein hydrolase activator NlpD
MVLGNSRPPSLPPEAFPPAVARLRVQPLPLPAAAPLKVRRHTVAPGDTLWGIAAAAGVSVETLEDANHLTGQSVLRPGQVLEIPVLGATDSVRSTAPAPPPVRAEMRAEGRAYTVARGDTLWDIARRSGVGVEELASVNRLAVNGILHPGQVLSIPSPHRGAGAGALPRAAGGAAADRQPQASVALRARVRMVWPSSGIITSRFGWRIHPIFRTREFHTGVDIATRWGSPVLAARAGIVRFVGWMAGYGRMVVLDHGNGLETVYSHLSAALVKPGQRVAQGEVIGRIGSTGWSTGPHLLFEVRRNGVPVDPLRYLN